MMFKASALAHIAEHKKLIRRARKVLDSLQDRSTKYALGIALIIRCHEDASRIWEDAMREERP